MIGNPTQDAVLLGLAIPLALGLLWAVPLVLTRNKGFNGFFGAYVAGLLGRMVLMAVAVVVVATQLEIALGPFVAALTAGTITVTGLEAWLAYVGFANPKPDSEAS